MSAHEQQTNRQNGGGTESWRDGNDLPTPALSHGERENRFPIWKFPKRFGFVHRRAARFPPHEPPIRAQNGLLSPALSSRGGEGEDLAVFAVQGFKARSSASGNSLPKGGGQLARHSLGDGGGEGEHDVSNPMCGGREANRTKPQ